MARLRTGVLLVVLVACASRSPSALAEMPSAAPSQPGPVPPSTEAAPPAPKQPRPSPEQFRFLPAPESVVIGRRPQIEAIFPPDLPAKVQDSVVSINLENDKRPGDRSFFSRKSLSNNFELALTQGGTYTVRVTYTNSGGENSKAMMKGTLDVKVG